MFSKVKYSKTLIHYLSEFSDFSNSILSSLKTVQDYYDKTCNHQSATDNDCLHTINNLCDKVSYFEKYLKVSLDFYTEE